MSDGAEHAPYDAIAAWYDGMVESGSLPHSVALDAIDDLIGDRLEGWDLCGLACGQGVITRHLAQRGARVTGIDVSARLLEIARRVEVTYGDGITYVEDDARTLATQPDARFDGVVCNLALMDISDLTAVYGAVGRVLRPAGWFLISVTHPCFEPPHAEWLTDESGRSRRVVGGYFSEGFWRSTYREGVRGKVGAYHRTLSTYLNGLIDTGFAIEHLTEPTGTGPARDIRPGAGEVPWLLVVLCRKRVHATRTIRGEGQRS